MSDKGREDEVRRPRRQTVIASAVESALQRLPRALPVRVTKYEPDKQRVACKVLVMRPFFDESDARLVESIPVIPGVPVVFPGANGSFRTTVPISDGNLQINGATVPATLGLLIWADRSLDKWLTGNGDEVDPEFDHVNSIADGFFLPGLNPFGAPLASAPTDRMTIGRDQSPSDIEIDGQGNVNLANGSNGAAREGDPSQITAPPTGPLALWMSQVEGAINGIAPGVVTPLSSAFLTSPGITVKTGSSKVKIG
jgi:hypothetical protein